MALGGPATGLVLRRHVVGFCSAVDSDGFRQDKLMEVLNRTR